MHLAKNCMLFFNDTVHQQIRESAFYTYIIDLTVPILVVSGYRYGRPGYDSLRYHIFREAGGLGRGPFSPVRIIDELL
jgi:hypothetical protein